MKKIVIATISSLSLIAATSAFADMTAQSGVYGSLAGGWSFAQSPSATNAGAGSANNKNYTGIASLGYDYAFDQNWMAGLEVGYAYFGKTNYSNPSGSIETTDAQVLATGTYLDNSGFNIFAKAGAINEYTKINDSVNAPATNGNTKVSKWLPAAALGLGYMPVQNLNVALQYEYTFGQNWNVNGNNNTVNKPMTQNAVTLGLSYKFAM